MFEEMAKEMTKGINDFLTKHNAEVRQQVLKDIFDFIECKRDTITIFEIKQYIKGRLKDEEIFKRD